MLVLKNATILTMVDPAFVGDIAIQDRKIHALGKKLDYEDAEIIDLRGCYVLPGLIDAHSHIGLFESGTRETEHNERTNPITPHMRAIDGINPADIAFYEARSSGFTTCVTGPGSINLIGGTYAAVKTYGNIVDKMILRYPVAMKAALGENPKFRYTERKMSPHTRMASAAIIREALISAIEYGERLKLAQDNPEKKVERNPRWEELLAVARGELPMKFHVHRADDIATAIRIANEFGLYYTLDHCTEGYLITDYLKEQLNGRCKGVIIGPLSNYKNKLEVKNKAGHKLAKKLYDAEIPFAIASDFPVLTYEAMLASVALSVKEGLPEEIALKSITLEAAKITGIDDRVGSLEVGKDADLAVFSGNPLDYKSYCQMTIINGEIVYRKAF
jgi:imidazolonepropionase-like amidohydrolase